MQKKVEFNRGKEQLKHRPPFKFDDRLRKVAREVREIIEQEEKNARENKE